MTVAGAVSLALVILALAILAWRRARTSPERTSRSSARGEQATAALRSMALTSTAASSGIEVPKTEHGVWGCVADLSLKPGAAATVVALIDGSASIYWGSSGGVIGGGAHERVRRGAQKLVSIAESFASQLRPTGIHDIPSPGKVRLYAQTPNDLLSSDELPLQELSQGTHPMSTFFAAVNDLITELRLVGNVGA
jgi:hypothetical protein